MTVEMIPVASSNLAQVGYDEENRELIVEFKNGRRYAYSGTDKVLFDDLIASPSPGEYFARHIRNVYPARQL